jgi:iron(III) transport system permease protein
VVDGSVTLQPLFNLLADRHVRQVALNTLALGATVAVLGTTLATLYAYAMTRIALPWKPLWHFIALLPTISPPVADGVEPDPPVRPARACHARDAGTRHHGAVRLPRPCRRADPVVLPVCVPAAAEPVSQPRRLAGGGGRHHGRPPAPGVPDRDAAAAAAGLASSIVLLFSYSLADLGNPLLLGGDYEVLSSVIYQTIIGLYDMPKGAALA